MRLFLDQDVYAVTVRHLRSMGHDLITAAERGVSRSDDLQLLDLAAVDSRILLTRDRDFGELVFVRGNKAGVIYLRILPSTVQSVHSELDRVLMLLYRGRTARCFHSSRAGAP